MVDSGRFGDAWVFGFGFVGFWVCFLLRAGLLGGTCWLVKLMICAFILVDRLILTLGLLTYDYFVVVCLNGLGVLIDCVVVILQAV